MSDGCLVQDSSFFIPHSFSIKIWLTTKESWVRCKVPDFTTMKIFLQKDKAVFKLESHFHWEMSQLELLLLPPVYLFLWARSRRVLLGWIMVGPVWPSHGQNYKMIPVFYISSSLSKTHCLNHSCLFSNSSCPSQSWRLNPVLPTALEKHLTPVWTMRYQKSIIFILSLLKNVWAPSLCIFLE